MRAALVGFLCMGMALLFALPARAQTAMDALRFTQRAPASSARMMGMAGAGTAGLDDYAAFVYNPAALGYFPHSEVSGAFRALSTTDEARYQAPGTDPSSLDGDVRDYGISNLAYLYKAPTDQGSFVLGAALNQVNTYERVLSFQGTNTSNSITDTFLPAQGGYELNENDNPVFFSDFPLIAYNAGAIEFRPDFLDDDPSAYPFLQAVTPQTTIQQTGEVTEGGRMRELNIGGAIEAARGVMAGLSVNVAFGTYRFDRFYEEIDSQGENTEDLYDVLLEDGTLLRGFEELEVNEGFESDLTGINVRGGLSSELATGLRAGVSLESPTYYMVQENYFTEITTFFDEGGSLSYGGEADDVGTGDFEYEIRTPWRVSAGLAWTVGAATISGDVEFVDWAQMELSADDDPQYFETTNPVNPTIREQFEPVINTRLGFEYRFDRLSLRAGGAYYPDPVEHQASGQDGENTFSTATAYYSAGVGYRLSERLALDMAWMMERFEDRYEPYGAVTVPAETDDSGNPVTIAPPTVDEEVTRNRFRIGVRYAF